GDVGAIFVAEQVLQQDLQAEGEAGRAFRSVQPVDLVPLARDLKGRPAAEAVRRHRVLSLLARMSAVTRSCPTYSISISSYLARVRQENLDVKLLCRDGRLTPRVATRGAPRCAFR